MSLRIVPVTFKQACQFVQDLHRHHKEPRGHKFSFGVSDGQSVVGVAIVGRPVARMSDDGNTLEVTRVCTDGTRNACSKLYGAARRVTFELGYTRLITYTLEEEGGASLRAAGWERIGEAGGGSWSRENRPRTDAHPLQPKVRWQIRATAQA